MGYYYLPPDTLHVGRLSRSSKGRHSPACRSGGSPARLGEPGQRVRQGQELRCGGDSAGLASGLSVGQTLSGDTEKDRRESQAKIAANVLILMNKTLKIECFVKSDIFSFTILSDDQGGADLIQGSIKGISSYLSFDSTESVYQGKINLYRALLYSSLTNKPLLLTVSEYDPVISEISEIYSGLDKRQLVAVHSSHQSDSCRDPEHSNNYMDLSSFDNDHAFEDAVEDYDSTLDVFFSYKGGSPEEDLLDISIVSSPVEFYWDKPTITSLIDCIKSYQLEVSRIAKFHLETMSRIYCLNKFYFSCIEAGLVTEPEITSIYGNTFRLCDRDHYDKLQLLMNLRDFLVLSKREEQSQTQTQNLDLDQELRFIMDNLQSQNGWIHCMILMPPRFSFVHIQRVYLVLSDLYFSSQSSCDDEEDLLDSLSGSHLSPTLNRISLSKSRRQSSVSEETGPDGRLPDRRLEAPSVTSQTRQSSVSCSFVDVDVERERYYQDWMASGLFSPDLDESGFSIGSDRIGLPEFSFNIDGLVGEDGVVSETGSQSRGGGGGRRRRRSPRVRLTHIIKGGSLSMIKDEKIYITAGVNNICICVDIFGTGDKAIKISVDNCSLTINGKCILTRHSGPGSQSLGSDRPLLLMYINLYSSPPAASRGEERGSGDVGPTGSRDELNVAFKCYMDSICYILYSKDVLEFVEYINDGILDTLISRSYKAAKDITAKKVFLYYLSIGNSVIKLPEDHPSSKVAQILQSHLGDGIPDDLEGIESYINPMDVFDETLKRYKDALQDLLQELYVESRGRVAGGEEEEASVRSLGAGRTASPPGSSSTDHTEISSYILSRINNRESLILLEKSISDYPRFRSILYDVELFDGTQSYCEIKTRNIKVYNKLAGSLDFMKDFYGGRRRPRHADREALGSMSQRIWTTILIIKQGVLDIVEREGGSEAIQGRVLPDLNALVEFGTARSFPGIRIGRILCDLETLDCSSEDCEEVSLLNADVSPLELSLSRQQLTFVLSVIAENLLNQDSKRRDSISEGTGIDRSSDESSGEIRLETDGDTERMSVGSGKRKSMLVNVRVPRLSLETSFSHVSFTERGPASASLPLLLVKLTDCEIRSRVLSAGDERLTSIQITSKKYQFDDIRLTSNLRFRRIVHGFTLGRVLCNETLSWDGRSPDMQSAVAAINRDLEQERCSIQFVCQISNKYGSHILLKAFNPRVFFGFNCIIDFYYYLSHSWRSSAFSKVVVGEDLRDPSKIQGGPLPGPGDADRESGENDPGLSRSDLKASESSTSRLFRSNKENVIQEFESILARINRSSFFKFEFKLEIENGIFGFTSHPQKRVGLQEDPGRGDGLILIWETDIDCSITTYRGETMIRNLNLLNSLVYFTEIQRQGLGTDEQEGPGSFSSSLLRPILERDGGTAYSPMSFEIPRISVDSKKIIIAESFNILTSGRYLSNIRDIPEIYSTLISLSELIFLVDVDRLSISISPDLLSILLEIARNLFSDGPTISPLYTSTLKSDSGPEKDGCDLIKQESEDDLEGGRPGIRTLGPPPIRRIYDLRVRLDNLSIRLVGDDSSVSERASLRQMSGNRDHPYYRCGYLPVLNFEISIPEWRIEIIPIKTNHTVKDASVKISILDINNRLWEPVLEKCVFSVYYFYDHLILYDPYVKPFKKSHRKYLHSTFSQTVLVNIKPSILGALKSYYSYYCGRGDDLDSAPSRSRADPDLPRPVGRVPAIIELESLSRPASIVSADLTGGSSIKYLNLTGFPYYCFSLKGDKLQESDGEFCLGRLFMLAPCCELEEIRLGPGQSQDASISLKYVNNCSSQIPLLRVSLPDELLCVFSAPMDMDVLRLKREFRTLDIEFIIRVLVVYRSYNLAQNVLKHYRDLSNHDDICNRALGPLPNGLFFTHFQDNLVSSACIDTIIPFHNLYYLKGKISKDSETYSRLFSDLKLDSLALRQDGADEEPCVEGEENDEDEEDEGGGGGGGRDEIGREGLESLGSRDQTQAQAQAKIQIQTDGMPPSSLKSKSLSESISRSLSKSSMRSFQSGIRRSLLKKAGFGGFARRSRSKKTGSDASYLYRSILGEVVPISSSEKLFCLISSHRIVNRTGIPLEICFLNENNVPIQLFDVSKVSVGRDLADLILDQEVPNNQSKYRSNLGLDKDSRESRKLRENSEYQTDQRLGYNEARSIPLWLNNTDIINTILSSMSQIYNSENDVSDILQSSPDQLLERRPKQKRFYYSYFLPNDHMMSVPQIALLNGYCKIIFRPCIIGLLEIYNIHCQYNNDNDIDQMLFDKEIFNKYSRLMSRYNDENIFNDEFHQITYELLKIFKTSSGEFILDLYYTFWNNLISRFTDPSTDLMDLSYLQSRGWTHSPLEQPEVRGLPEGECNILPVPHPKVPVDVSRELHHPEHPPVPQLLPIQLVPSHHGRQDQVSEPEPATQVLLRPVQTPADAPLQCIPALQ
ncbi:hypothetical protein OIY81_2911 [Cryptosporidium canis]|nr:hypothetical protein OIY81_2911 [Cryptosporidium canis]